MVAVEEIYRRVSATLVEALNVDEADIKPASTLQGELGAESIDLIDILFRLEQEFGIEIPRGELFPEAIFRKDLDLVQEGKVTARGLRELAHQMPFADLARFTSNSEFVPLSDLFTVNLVAQYVQAKLAGANPLAPDSTDATPPAEPARLHGDIGTRQRLAP
jgi:acyl carrier protein